MRGRVKGLITRCGIHSNDYEGLRIEALDSYDPSIAARVNNISGNSEVGARLVTTMSLTTKSSSTSMSTSTSGAWNAPTGATVDMVRWSYSEYDYKSVCTGRILNAKTGSALKSSGGAMSTRWSDVSAGKAPGIKVSTYESGSYSYRHYWGETKAYAVAYTKPGAVAEVSVVTNTAKIDLRHNWLGVFPDVHKVVTLAHTNAANLHGFVGKIYGSTWDSGPYYGGTSFTKDVNWSGEVWITGDITVPNPRSLNVAAGTKVHVVRFDQDKNGTGDFKVNITGKFNVSGTKGSPVTVSMYGANKSTRAWDAIRVYGSSSAAKIKWAVFEYGRIGVQLDSGTHSVSDSIVRHCGNEGIYMGAPSNVKITNVQAHDNGTHGLYAYSGKGVLIDGGKVESNKLSGVRGNNTYMTIKNLYINKNGGAGVRLDDTDAQISQCSIKSNALGVWFRRKSRGTLTKCDVLYNQGEGVFLSSDGVQSPYPKITYNNIFGNSVTAGGIYKAISSSAKSSSTSMSSKAGAAWKTPKGEEVVYARASYTEYDYKSVCSGRIQTDKGGTLYTSSSGMSTRWVDVGGKKAKGLRAYVYESGSYSYRHYWGEMKLYGAFYRASNVLKELSAITDSGKVACTHNHWGMKPKKDPKDPNEIQFPYLGQEVLLKLTLSRTDAVDISSAQGPINNTGPQ